MTIKFIKGDMLKGNEDVICDPVNTVGVWHGSGLHAYFVKAFPGLRKSYLDAVKNKPWFMGNIVYVTNPKRNILLVPTKSDWRKDSDGNDIMTACMDIYDKKDVHGYKTVAMPMLGTGKGGLSKKEVAQILLLEFKDCTELHVNVYY